MQGEFRGDFSRDSFDAFKRFSRVLMQQGRVQLDSDWNEQTDILMHYLRSLATDLIGPHGGSGEPGFALITTDTEIDNLKDANGAALSEEARRKLKSSLHKSGFLFGIGRYYVDGLLCENDGYLGFTEQPGYPAASLTLDDIRDEAGTYLVFLDVWERHVSCNEDGEICEVALGGPDTATRGQIVSTVVIPAPGPKDAPLYDQQLLADDLKKLREAEAVANNQPAINDALNILNGLVDQVRLALRGSSKATLRARAKITGLPEGDCNIQPEAQYRGPENQLYRVEIQRGGVAWNGVTEDEEPAGNATTAATFKWSRDNSSIYFQILNLQGDSVRLASVGRDGSRSLQVDDWVEIVADDLALQGQPGPLRQVKSINPDEMTITLTDTVDLNYDESSTLHPLLRRWDQRDSDGEAAESVLLVKEGEEDLNWIELEDGVQIQFPQVAGNHYRAGDYWLIPARVATGDVLWPKVRQGNKSVAKALPPHGIDHHYAPLAIISIDGAQKITVEHDCRRIFGPLAR